MKTKKTLIACAAMLYGALSLSATPAAADLSATEVAALKEARTGDMRKLIIHNEPRERLEATFLTGDDNEMKIADFDGKVMVVNFWATWCPPCRKEMPYIDQLKADIAGDDVGVIAISLDRASTSKIEDFFASINVESLDIYREPSLRMGSEAAVLGMPVTLILDRQGREVARLQGEAVWNAPEAKKMISDIMLALDSADG
ncbi:MAG: TlpA disulfide reductase family protein [Pseudomonadota bacterium]